MARTQQIGSAGATECGGGWRSRRDPPVRRGLAPFQGIGNGIDTRLEWSSRVGSLHDVARFGPFKAIADITTPDQHIHGRSRVVQ